MGWRTQSTFYARKPLRAEHPIGSGTIVEYKPGDVIPAGEWGPAANWLVENGRAAEMFDNVWVDEEGASGPPPDTQVREHSLINAGDMHQSGPPSQHEGEGFPRHHGAGHYELSDGSRVRGKEDAIAAQAALGGSE
jgi:hypothetical protein